MLQFGKFEAFFLPPSGEFAQILPQCPGGPGDEDQPDGPRHARSVLRRGGADHPASDGGGSAAEPDAGFPRDAAEEPGRRRQGRLLPGQQNLQTGT